jgi:hypothetical protein
MPIVPHDAIVSKNARDRFMRWRDDLKRAGGVPMNPGTPTSTSSGNGEEEMDIEYEGITQMLFLLAPGMKVSLIHQRLAP